MEYNPFGKTTLKCPVGGENLGYLTKGEVCSYTCNDCGFIYTWDTKGKLKPPVKLKPPPKVCKCGNCGSY